MGSGKAVYQPPPAASYRDVPDYAETASMSSAVLLEDVEAAFPDEELPPYQDEPVEAHLLPTASASTSNAGRAHTSTNKTSSAPPDLPFQTHDHSCREYRTRFPLYSTDSESLYKAIKEQAFYPPNYQVQIYGSHTETRRNGNKETKARVDDFLIVIDITNLLGGLGKGTFEILPNNKRGYRGTRIPSLHPTIINHDKKRLEQLLRSAIADTNYRGHVSIDFAEQRTSLIVYSPGKINEVEDHIVDTLGVLLYETVKAVYRYADQPPGDDTRRRCIVMTEVEWFHRWQSAIKRAAIARMMCRDGALDEHYRLATERTDVRGELHGRQPEAPRTGNAFADGAIGLLGQGLRLASDYNDARGWGADS
ncbi:uncharacterized protein RSE6_01696 [Rhynchosporium secalis]|uniref:Uncharacterized protein n=1 Tax=Rhynchosporium secalis TaxID=38038 RepID=A0A1E1LYH6_RHYSE|nr:uncharacterized protein RSE6_01696 [Rhynchosporium secalis]